MLTDAQLGNFITRSEWVSGIIDRMDLNKDDGISRDELEALFFPQERLLRRRRKILVAFYKKYSPEKLDEVDALLQKLVSFKGDEKALVRLLKKKYGVA